MLWVNRGASMKKLASVLLLSSTLLLCACGGGGGSDASSSTTTSGSTDSSKTATTTTAPGGLYIGYYQEDPTTNPEDPTAGVVYFILPNGDGSFSGSLYFTYVGCQTSNVGVVSGNKLGLALSGTWSGTIDGSAQSGAYSLAFDNVLNVYSGTYNNDKGKQFRDLRPCVQYTIAPNGTVELFPVGTLSTSISGATATNVSGANVTWSASGVSQYLVGVIDTTALSVGAGTNAVVWQSIVAGTTTSAALPTLVSGRSYIVLVAGLDSSYKRIYFSSKQFVAL